MKITGAEKLALLKRNTIDLLVAWGLLPRAIAAIKEEAGGAIGALLDALSTLGVALLSLLIILLAPFFFWLSPIVTYRQIKNLKPRVDNTDVWNTKPYFKDEKQS